LLPPEAGLGQFRPFGLFLSFLLPPFCPLLLANHVAVLFPPCRLAKTRKTAQFSGSSTLFILGQFTTKAYQLQDEFSTKLT